MSDNKMMRHETFANDIIFQSDIDKLNLFKSLAAHEKNIATLTSYGFALETYKALAFAEMNNANRTFASLLACAFISDLAKAIAFRSLPETEKAFCNLEQLVLNDPEIKGKLFENLPDGEKIKVTAVFLVNIVTTEKIPPLEPMPHEISQDVYAR